MKKIIVGLTESVIVKGSNKSKKVTARVDTGAECSSLDVSVAAELKLGPILKTKSIKSVHGKTIRPVVKAKIIFKNNKLVGDFNLADRSHLKYKVLIGQDILSKIGLLVDPSKK